MITYLLIATLIHLLLLISAISVSIALPKAHAGEAPEAGQELPLVSICIPARNEEANIATCVTSACAQTYPKVEVIVLDDNSEDRTGVILAGLQQEQPRLRTLTGKPLPAGWLGKPHALWQAQGEAKGEYLLFIDADCELDSRCLDAVMAAMLREDAAFLTLVPKLVMSSFWEWTAQAAVLKSILGILPVHLAADPEHPAAIANGPFMLFKREVYDAIGGHEAIKGEVVEDRELAKALKAHKRPIRYTAGVGLQRVHMYQGFGEIWRGWSKNFFISMDRSVAAAMAVTVVLLGLWIGPYVALLSILAQGTSGGLGGATMALGYAGAFLLVRYAFHRAMKAFYDLDEDYWYLEALGYLVMIGIIWNSALVTLLNRPLAWRGRSVHVAQEPLAEEHRAESKAGGDEKQG